jgi:hypothetical protein
LPDPRGVLIDLAPKPMRRSAEKGYVIHSMDRLKSTPLSLLRQYRRRWTYKHPGRLPQESPRPGCRSRVNCLQALELPRSSARRGITQRFFRGERRTLYGCKRVISIPCPFLYAPRSQVSSMSCAGRPLALQDSIGPLGCRVGACRLGPGQTAGVPWGALRRRRHGGRSSDNSIRVYTSKGRVAQSQRSRSRRKVSFPCRREADILPAKEISRVSPETLRRRSLRSGDRRRLCGG